MKQEIFESDASTPKTDGCGFSIKIVDFWLGKPIVYEQPHVTNPSCSQPSAAWKTLCVGKSVRKGAEHEVAGQLHRKEQHTNEAQKANLAA